VVQKLIEFDLCLCYLNLAPHFVTKYLNFGADI